MDKEEKMSYLKIEEKIKKIFAIVIVIAIALIVSAPGILLLIYIMQHEELNILIVTAGIIILSVKPVKKTAKKIGFKNLIKINSGKYPAPVENPAIRYQRKSFPY